MPRDSFIVQPVLYQVTDGIIEYHSMLLRMQSAVGSSQAPNQNALRRCLILPFERL